MSVTGRIPMDFPHHQRLGMLREQCGASRGTPLRRILRFAQAARSPSASPAHGAGNDEAKDGDSHTSGGCSAPVVHPP
jgi:hypothetical protein